MINPYKILQYAIQMKSLLTIKVAKASLKAVQTHYSPIDTSIGAEGDFVCQTEQPGAQHMTSWLGTGTETGIGSTRTPS